MTATESVGTGLSIKRGIKHSKRAKRKPRRHRPEDSAESANLNQASGERSVAIGGDATRAVIATGDHNVINVILADERPSRGTIQEVPSNDREEFDRLHRRFDELREPVGVSELRGKVELIGSLYAKGKLGLVLEEGEGLREPVLAAAPSKLKNRLFTILSSAKLRLGRPEEAVADAEDSLRGDPENTVLVENAANVNLLAGNLQRAAELARTALARENSAAALSVLVQTTFSEVGQEAVSGLVEQHPWAVGEPLIHAALAVTYLREEDLDRAETWLRRDPPSQLNEPHEADHLTFLAELLIERTQKEFAQTLPLPWELSQKAREPLAEAVELTSKVVDFWTGKEPVAKLGRALTERATAKLLGGQSQLALNDLKAASALGVEDELSTLVRLRTMLDLDQPEKVVELVENLPIEGRIKGCDGLLGAALHRLGLFGRAAEAFEREVAKGVTVNERLASLEALLSIYGRQADVENAERVRARLQAEGAHRATSVAALAMYRYRQSDHNEAHALFREALDLPGGTSLVRFEYADVLAGEGRWPEAADLVGPLLGLEAEPSVLRRYAVWLFKAQRFREALGFTASARARHGVLPVVTAIEANLRQMASDYAATVPLLTELEKLETSDERHRLALLSTYIGLGDTANAKLVLDRIDAAELRGQPHDLMWLAQTTQALDVAVPPNWRGRRSGLRQETTTYSQPTSASC